MVSKLGTSASFNVSPFDCNVYEIIKNKLITLAGKFCINRENAAIKQISLLLNKSL